MYLLTIPNQNLRKKAKTITSISSVIPVIGEMSRIRQENCGAGIAAPQVGELLRIINFIYKGNEMTVINPIIKHKKGIITIREGCLSIPDLIYEVKRPKSLTLFGEDIHGKDIKLKCDIYHAYIVAHEVDHLDGILIDIKGKLVKSKK